MRRSKPWMRVSWQHYSSDECVLSGMSLPVWGSAASLQENHGVLSVAGSGGRRRNDRHDAGGDLTLGGEEEPQVKALDSPVGFWVPPEFWVELVDSAVFRPALKSGRVPEKFWSSWIWEEETFSSHFLELFLQPPGEMSEWVCVRKHLEHLFLLCWFVIIRWFFTERPSRSLSVHLRESDLRRLMMRRWSWWRERSDSHRGGERVGGTEEQRNRGTEEQRNRGTEEQRRSMFPRQVLHRIPKEIRREESIWVRVPENINTFILFNNLLILQSLITDISKFRQLHDFKTTEPTFRMF